MLKKNENLSYRTKTKNTNKSEILNIRCFGNKGCIKRKLDLYFIRDVKYLVEVKITMMNEIY